MSDEKPNAVATVLSIVSAGIFVMFWAIIFKGCVL